MTFTIDIPNKGIVECSAWTIGDEKRTLLALKENSSKKQQITDIFNNLIGDVNVDLTYQEKLYILLYMRSKISDNTLTPTYKCPKCNQMTEGIIRIDESIHLSESHSFEYAGIKYSKIGLCYSDTFLDSIEYIKKNSKVVEDIVGFLDGLSMRDYDDLIVESSKIPSQFTFDAKTKCLICDHETSYEVSEDELINIIMTVNLVSYYDIIVSLRKHGFAISEVESFMPFELDVIMNTIAKHIKNSKE